MPLKRIVRFIQSVPLLRVPQSTRESLRFAGVVAFSACYVALVMRLDASPQLHTPSTGAEQIVFDWKRDACASDDFPDVPARAFRDRNGAVQVIASHYVNRRIGGSDFGQLKHDCAVILDSNKNADPARFDDRGWIHATHTPDGQTVYALLHNEYQGNTHKGACPSNDYNKCWYNALTLAVSRDGGRKFAHAAAPNHLVAALPSRYVPDGGRNGPMSPSNILRARDGFYYVLFRVFRRSALIGTCVMRTKTLADPKSWRAWDGTAFNASFSDPYRGAEISDRATLPFQPVARGAINGMSESVTWNTFYKKYLLVGLAPDPNDSAEWNVYFSLSDDLINWQPRRLLLACKTPWTWKCGDDAEPLVYPSLIDHNSTSRNFQTSGKRAYLYFTRFRYASCKRTGARDLVRVPVEFN